MMQKMSLIILLLSALAQASFGAKASGLSKASRHPDLIKITQARFYYNDHQYAQAIAQYNTVPKSSDFWLLAVEERAHTFGKMGQYEKAIADFTTIFSPLFVNSATPEAYFTAALVHLRLCQYSQVYDVISNFKNNMGPRSEALSDLADRKSDRFVEQVVSDVRAKGMASATYLKVANKLPLNFQYDTKMNELMKLSVFDKKTKNLIVQKMAELAKQDLADIRLNIDKLGLVEAEMMQRLHFLDGRDKSDRPVSGRFKSDSNQLVFPFNDELWLDEIDSYQVKAKACPRVKAGA